MATGATPSTEDRRPWRRSAERTVAGRSVWSLLAAATIVAAALRLPFLGHTSLWFDEIYTRDVLGASTVSDLWNHIKATESTPPLYYFLGWILGGRSAAAMRLIPSLALIAAVPISYLAFRRLVGRPGALGTAAIVAVSPILVSYSSDARSYGLLVLTGLLSVWSMSALLETGSRTTYALWVVACVACVWTHYFGAFLVAGELVVLLAGRREARLATIGCSALIAAFLVPLVPLAINQSGDARAGFIAGMSLASRLSMTARQLALGPNVPRTWLEATGLGLFCLGAAAGTAFAIRAGAPPRALLAVTAIALGAPLLLAILGVEDRFYARNLLAAAPLLAAVAAPAMLQLRAVPLLAYLVLATLTSVWVATNWRYEQADWHSALVRAEAIDPNAAVVAVTALSAPVARTYLDRQASTAGVVTRRAWVIVEPIRTAGHRALGPAPSPPLAGFSAVRTLVVHGFMLSLRSATRPTRIVPGEIPTTTVFPGAGR